MAERRREVSAGLPSKFAYEGPWNRGTIRLEADTLDELVSALETIDQSASSKSLTDQSSEETSANSTYPSISRVSGCADAIKAVLTTVWGRTEGRTEAEIIEAMKANALHFPRGTVSGLLTYLTRRGDIERRGKKGGSYAYSIP